MARALKLVIHVIIPFKVSTRSGEKLICDKVCKDVEIKVQGTIIKMDIFLLPMAGSNMVIGIQGLKTLGTVTFNFEKLWMKFDKEGSTVMWHGCSWISEDPLTTGQLKCLIASTQEAYICYLEKVTTIWIFLQFRLMKLNLPLLYKNSQTFLSHQLAYHPRERGITIFTWNPTQIQ